MNTGSTIKSHESRRIVKVKNHYKMQVKIGNSSATHIYCRITNIGWIDKNYFNFFIKKNIDKLYSSMHYFFIYII